MCMLFQSGTAMHSCDKITEHSGLILIIISRKDLRETFNVSAREVFHHLNELNMGVN